ncbi:MAG: hypothetical protein HY688_04585 [Chloroflexi bacterium]|nr:hypothetical protein [Chloroflexota bacterium]
MTTAWGSWIPDQVRNDDVETGSRPSPGPAAALGLRSFVPCQSLGEALATGRYDLAAYRLVYGLLKSRQSTKEERRAHQRSRTR